MKGFFASLIVSIMLTGLSMTATAQTAELLGPGAPPFGPTHVGSEDVYDRLAFRPPYVPRGPRVITKGALAPSIDDRTAFATLLRDKKTGLIRLLPREGLESKMNDEKKKLFRIGGGTYFSFANRMHVFGLGSDIGFDHNKLSVGFAGYNYGMLTNLGDTPLEQISLSDKRVKSIAAVRPPRSREAAAVDGQHLKSAEGMTFDGRAYRNQLPVQEDSTYILRSIVYGRSDVLVAFRLVRKDADGSVIIAWKLLKQYSTPKLKPTMSIRTGVWNNK